MTGKVVYSPKVQHRCFALFPPEAGLFCRQGTRWRCDTCGATWELISGHGWTIISTSDNPLAATPEETHE